MQSSPLRFSMTMAGFHKMRNRLKELLDQRGWSERELARRSGLTHSKVNRLVNALDPLDDPNIERIAETMGIQPDHIFLSPDELAQEAEEREALALARGMSPEERAAWLTMGRLARRPRQG